MTVDEELSLLEDSLRRLKVEYDIYFGGGTPRPPYDSQWRVESLIKKYSDNSKLTFAQRFRFNGLTQKFAVYHDMWRQKVKHREEGREEPWRRREQAAAASDQPAAFRVQWRDPEKETDKVDKLFEALVEAKKKCGENAESLSLDGFKRFVKQKTDQLKRDFGCQNVEYAVEVENGQVRLKAKGS